MSTKIKYNDFKKSLPQHVTLIAVSKTKTESEILELYEAGHRDFGENYVQELLTKQQNLPKDIRWHFIGHLQSNKVKYLVPFVYLIHSADSFKLVKEINKQGEKAGRKISVLLQAYAGNEETKFGLSPMEIKEILQNSELDNLNYIEIKGLMAMATNTHDEKIIESEFVLLHRFFQEISQIKKKNFSPTVLSMGMSSDYSLAVKYGSNMIRIGSLLFGERNYKKAQL